MKILSTVALLLATLHCQADTPASLRQAYAAEAGKAYQSAPARGEALFRQNFAVNEKMPACTACHTSNPANVGQHAITGKAIRPLAVSANPERFTDPAKVEKWFGRNCKEVIGRACTPAEKADFVAYMSEVR